jgi:outer membrane protein OmpA-like peptidoglycan-associated protein
LKSSFLDSISPRSKRLVAWTAAVISAYTVVGFFLLPPLVRVIAVKQLSKQLDRPVTIQKVRLNPYTFSATIRGLLVQDKDGAPLVSWDAAQVNFQLISLFSHAWVFKEISVAQPFVRVQVNQDYTLNFADIMDKFSQAGSKPAGKPRPWRIDRLRVIGGKIAFADLTLRTPFRKIVGPLQLTVANFQTDSGHKNVFALSGISESGEQFAWKGSFRLAPFRSEGDFSLDGFALTPYTPLYQDLFRFEIKDGVIGLRSSYRYESSAATNLLALTNVTFELKCLQIVEKDTGQAAVEVPDFVMTGASVDTMARQAEADTMTVTGGRFFLRRNKDTSVNAIELLKPADSAPPVPGGIILLLRAMTNLVTMLLTTTNLSNGTIRELSFTNCALHLEDLANPQPVRLDLEDIAVQGKNISNRTGSNMTAGVSLRWDTNGTVRADIQAALSPARAEVTLRLDRLNLRPLAPYLEPHLDVFVLGSKLGLAGTVRLDSTRDELPEVRFRGDAWLDDFSLAEGLATEGLLQWKSLRLSGIEANLNPPVVSVAQASLEDVFARLIIETNRTVNLMSALRRGGTHALPLTNLMAAAARPKISVASMVVSNANVHFIDRSLQPNVNITLEQLSGTLSGLSSDDPQRADLHLEGTVDKTARADITGKINPWNSKQPLNLKIALQGMDLLPADPYSGKYLGYRLKQGKLSAQLTYQVTERKLESENRLTLDQLTLGQKVESAEATRLPVRMAIALLKDRDGRIALDVPVNGSLDDPQFNLGQVAYRALERILNRIVTSPFSALSALFGGKGEELSFQEFQPGSTNLLPAALAKLDVMANALYERPELRLEIEGSTDPQTDLDALRRAELNKQSLVQRWNAAANLFSAGTNAAAIESPPAQSSRGVVSFEKGASALTSPVAHSSLFETKSTTKESPFPHSSAAGFADNKGATALMLIFAPAAAPADPDWDRELLEAVGIAPDALPKLAAERARNVRAYLLQTGKVAPERITESARGAGSEGSRVYLRPQ